MTGQCRDHLVEPGDMFHGDVDVYCDLEPGHEGDHRCLPFTWSANGYCHRMDWDQNNAVCAELFGKTADELIWEEDMGGDVVRDVDPWGTVVEIRVHEEPDPDNYPGCQAFALLMQDHQEIGAEQPWLMIWPTLYNPGCGEGLVWAGHGDVADWTVVR